VIRFGQNQNLASDLIRLCAYNINNYSITGIENNLHEKILSGFTCYTSVF